MLLRYLFVLVLQWLPISAQVSFSSPTAGEVIDGGVPFIVSVTDSSTAPYFSQMTGFSLLLLAWNFSSPVTLYAWDLSTTPPSTVSNSITFPPSIGPSASSAYFLGIRGSILANTSISVTYFSPLFTLQNMTGDTSLLPSILGPTPTDPRLAPPVTPVASPGRLITCDSTTANGDVQKVGEPSDNGGVFDQACELEVLSYLSVLITQTRTVTAITALVTTTPPAVSAFSALFAPTSPSSSTSDSGSQPSTTSAGLQPISTNNSSGSGIASPSGSSSHSSKMVYMLIIAGLVLATVIALFWIWTKYGRRRYQHGGCEHLDCGCSGMKKMWDGIKRPILYGRMELDAERGRLVTVWRNKRGSKLTGGSARSRKTGVLSDCRRDLKTDGVGRRSIFVQARGGAGDRRSRRTILAELEGDFRQANLMLEKMPSPDSDRQMKPPLPVPALDKRAIVVGKGEQGTIVRGKDAAFIVEVGKKRLRSDSGATATIQQSEDLQHIPPTETHECCENSHQKKRQGQGEDTMRICEMREEIYVMRKEESLKQEIGRRVEEESCAPPFGNCESISS